MSACTRPPREWEPCALPSGHKEPCRPTPFLPLVVEPPQVDRPNEWPGWFHLLVLGSMLAAYVAFMVWAS